MLKWPSRPRGAANECNATHRKTFCLHLRASLQASSEGRPSFIDIPPAGIIITKTSLVALIDTLFVATLVKGKEEMFTRPVVGSSGAYLVTH